ncbi:MAG TPA: hypothetical protein VGH27_01365 [Streptosporangiaceae bacterium]|jgi:hypothetical protein
MRAALTGLALAALAVTGSATTTAVPVSASATSWTIQPTPSLKGQPGYLTDVACYSADGCLAVGGHNPNQNTDQGLIEQWQDGTWKKLAVAVNNATPEGVSCTSGPSCLLVGVRFAGTSTLEWAMEWSGGRWTADQPPAAAGLTSILTGASCVSATDCLAVGWDASSTVTALVQQWDGHRWSDLPAPHVPGAVQTHLLDISCPTSKDCIAVGSYIYKGVGKQHPLAAQWNGERWAVQQPPVPSSASASLTAVSCASASSCTAVGQRSLGGTRPLAEVWNGHAWTEQTVGPAGGGLTGISCVSAISCTAVGDVTNSSGGAALADRWNGSTWAVQPTATPARDKVLNGVSCVSAGTCTAVGINAEIDGGTLAEHE